MVVKNNGTGLAFEVTNRDEIVVSGTWTAMDDDKRDDVGNIEVSEYLKKGVERLVADFEVNRALRIRFVSTL